MIRRKNMKEKKQYAGPCLFSHTTDTKAPQLWLWKFGTATTLWSFKVPSLIDLIIMTEVHARISLEKLVPGLVCKIPN